MKALVKENKLKGLSLLELEKPEVKSDSLLVKIKAGSICGTDLHLFNSSRMIDTWNIELPLIIGHEICGEIVDIGKEANYGLFKFQIGDRIAADSHVHCGICPQCVNNKTHNCDTVKVLGVHTQGAFSEYSNIPANICFKIADSISFEEGSMLEPFGVSVKSFYLSQPMLTDKVAIFGGGPIGLLIAKLALSSGIKDILIIEPSDYRRKMARNIGLVNCIDPASYSEDYDRYFDIVFEVSGSPEGLQTALKSARKNGKVIVIGIYPDSVLIDVKNMIMSKELTIFGTFGRLMWQTWFQMIDLLTNKQIDLNEVITHKFNIKDYNQAFKIAIEGKCGKVIINFD